MIYFKLFLNIKNKNIAIFYVIICTYTLCNKFVFNQA